MKCSLLASCALLFLLPLVVFSQSGATLQVQVKYTGSGTVDASHKIYVALWDSPDFAKGDARAMKPFAVAPVASKSGTVNFQDLTKNPVYVSMAYDPTGKWDAKEEPPKGASLGLYATTPGVPDPVQLTPGKTTKISVKLDDSFKQGQNER